MNTSRTLLPALLLACLPVLAACNRGPAPQAPQAPSTPADAATASEPTGVIARKVQDALRDASESLASKNIPVGGQQYHRNGIRFGRGNPGLPKAEITPQGDLLIDGKTVAVDETQRRLLLDHRANVVAVVQASIAMGMQGAELGMQGASLGMKAAAGALKSVFSGNTDEFEKQMEAEGKRIEAEGRRIEAEANRMICEHLPALLASQNALAAALPEFRPYADMNESDIKNCGEEGSLDFDSDNDQAAAEADAAGAEAPAP